jgi:hypothetical protein
MRDSVTRKCGNGPTRLRCAEMGKKYGTKGDKVTKRIKERSKRWEK